MKLGYRILILLGALMTLALIAGCTSPAGNSTANVIATPTTTEGTTTALTTTPAIMASSSNQTILSILQSEEQFSTFNLVIRKASSSLLRDILGGTQSFTVFAPTDAAFGNLSNETLETILNQPEGVLVQLVRYHIIPGSYPPEGLPQLVNMTIYGLSGEELSFATVNNTLTVNGATINTSAAINASNGYVYPIDTVLMRPNVTMTPTPTPLPTTATATTTAPPANLTLEVEGAAPTSLS